VREFLLILPILLLSVVAHEYGHAWTAFRQGDSTAHDLGRLTFNPLPHIDLVSSVILPATLWFVTSLTGHPFTFGAAKPVPINPANFRHYVSGDLLVSSAGIAMNALLALLFAAGYIALGVAGHALPEADIFRTMQFIATVGLSLNVLLALFNLIPLPPLDGSRLLFHALPAKHGARYQQVGRLAFAVLVLSFWIAPDGWNVILAPVDVITGRALAALSPWALGALP
jgi:Zn-dependent protease